MAKYFKLLDSVETEPVQPLDILSNEVTFSRKQLSWKKLVCAAMFIVLITLTIVFIALYAHEISKEKNIGTTGNSKGEMSTTERTKMTTATTTTTTGKPTSPTLHTTAMAKPVCLSHGCVLAAAG